ncbi:hypothetical protein NJT12_00680 [Flavobacterium sp. AC]|uniref:Uncharacterized protein n=1 Tax=Flavobacterium azizsancarii TaxID=2961580 RepID=A0ABT4W6C9_9FLAO|nr:hypothetical protein [Flavobacterium azizsancarii]MDA6068119.1 hypothetical protein [Flavobacterium azizsancarii]
MSIFVEFLVGFLPLVEMTNWSEFLCTFTEIQSYKQIVPPELLKRTLGSDHIVGLDFSSV